MSHHHIDPTPRVARAKRKIDTGFYDRPEVMDIATARLHAHLMEMLTADANRGTMKHYKVTVYGDGKGTEIISGEWRDVVEHVTKLMTFEPTTDDVLNTAEMLSDGFDGDPGWNGAYVCLSFEDGSITVEIMDARHAERLEQDASEPGREYDGAL